MRRTGGEHEKDAVQVQPLCHVMGDDQVTQVERVESPAQDSQPKPTTGGHNPSPPGVAACGGGASARLRASSEVG